MLVGVLDEVAPVAGLFERGLRLPAVQAADRRDGFEQLLSGDSPAGAAPAHVVPELAGLLLEPRDERPDVRRAAEFVVPPRRVPADAVVADLGERLCTLPLLVVGEPVVDVREEPLGVEGDIALVGKPLGVSGQDLPRDAGTVVGPLGQRDQVLGDQRTPLVGGLVDDGPVRVDHVGGFARDVQKSQDSGGGVVERRVVWKDLSIELLRSAYTFDVPMSISTDESGAVAARPTIERIDEGRSLDIDDVLDALAHEHRRYVLYYLQSRGTVPGEELVDVIRAAATGSDGETDEREAVLALRDEHLPALLDAGLITCDRGDRTVSLAFLPEFVYDWLDAARRADRRH